MKPQFPSSSPSKAGPSTPSKPSFFKGKGPAQPSKPSGKGFGFFGAMSTKKKGKK